MGKENIVHAIDSLDESRSGKTADIDSGPREIVVKTEQNVEYPADLMSVEKVKLVVERPVGPSLRQLHKKCASTLKNMKRFRKVINAMGEHQRIAENTIMHYVNMFGDCLWEAQAIGNYDFLLVEYAVE